MFRRVIVKPPKVIKALSILMSVLWVGILLSGCSNSQTTAIENEKKIDRSSPIIVPNKIRTMKLPENSEMKAYVTIDDEHLQEMSLNENGTASFNIDGISLGAHTLKFEFIVADQGTEYTIASFERLVIVGEGSNDLAELIGENIDVEDYEFPDEDNDGRSNFDEINEGDNPSLPNWTIGGEIVGLLSDEQIEITLNSGEKLSISDASFVFSNRIPHLKNYLVELVTAPVGFTCVAEANEGVASVHINNIQIKCILSAPVVTLNENIVVTEGEPVTISADTMYLNSQKGTLSYYWEHISGDQFQYLDNGDNISFVAPNEPLSGVYQVTVTDTNQRSSSDMISISVNLKSGFHLLPTTVGEAFKPLDLSITNITDESIDTLSYLWEILDRNDLSLENSDKQTATVIRLPDPGEAFVVRLTMTDEYGETTIDSVIVTVNATPIANAGPDQIITAGELVTVNSHNSIDSDGVIVSAEWREDGATLSTNMSFMLSNLAVGIHTLTLIVTDNEGASHTDTIGVTVDSLPVIPPTANAGSDQIIFADDSITMNGSKSKEGDGSITSYVWRENDIVLSNEIAFTEGKFSIGIHTLILTVTDNENVSASDSVIITVNNTPPIAEAGDNQSVVVGELVTFDGDDSRDSNLEGLIVEHAWYEGSQLLSTSASFTESNFTKGIHTLTLTVIDNHGASASDTVTITVNDPSNIPQLIANAGVDQRITVGEDVTLDGSNSSSVTVSMGGNLAYEWFEGGALLSSSISFTKNDFVLGVHTLTLTVTDINGVSASDTVTITVTEPLISDIHFPDSALKVCIDRIADKNQWILVLEFTSLICNGVGVADASGIEYLTYLKTIQLANNALTTIDLRQQTALTSVTIYDNQLSSIYFSELATIQSLNLSDNQLSEIDLLNQTALISLDLNGNQFSVIDLQHQTVLTNLYLIGNQLSHIDLQYHLALTHLYLSSNKFKQIDLQYQSVLIQLALDNNFISDINLDQQVKLVYLKIENNQLSNISLRNNTELATLYVWGNPLTDAAKIYLDRLGIEELEY